jgi:hypothetical protein
MSSPTPTPQQPPVADDVRCPDCGAPVAGGRVGCQALYDEIAVRAHADARYAAVRDLAFDTYCMQHVERYCRSAKSYAAHLSRLCCGLELGGNPGTYAAIQHWLNGPARVARPDPPAQFGRVTVADVHRATTAAEHPRLVRAWAEEVWDAYATQQELARSGVTAALGGKPAEPR